MGSNNSFAPVERSRFGAGWVETPRCSCSTDHYLVYFKRWMSVPTSAHPLLEPPKLKKSFTDTQHRSQSVSTAKRHQLVRQCVVLSMSCRGCGREISMNLQWCKNGMKIGFGRYVYYYPQQGANSSRLSLEYDKVKTILKQMQNKFDDRQLWLYNDHKFAKMVWTALK